MKTCLVFTATLLALTTLVESKWDTLELTWGAGLFGFFNEQPRTLSDAVDDGFSLVGPDSCNGTGQYLGYAYAKNGDDYIATLLYDQNGYIAGIQAGITEEQYQATGYPGASIRPPFAEADGRYVVTAYFVDPSTICTGRSASDYERDGTGYGLWVQSLEGPNTVTHIPMSESDVAGPWVKGNCFYTMGQHYWYDISDNMDCNDFMPVFLLYNGGQLNAFGWAFAADLDSSHFEHPDHNVFGLFMDHVPTCLDNAGTISTMHIYMTDRPRFNNYC